MDPRPDALPPLGTARLALRPLAPADAAEFHHMTDEPGILAAVHFLPDPFAPADAEALIRWAEGGREAFWGARPAGGGALLGTVGIHLRGVDEVEVGYWFAAAARGRGLAGEALGAVVAALRRAYPQRRIVAECRPENAASRRLLERAGFRDEGREGLRPGRRRLVLGPAQRNAV